MPGGDGQTKPKTMAALYTMQKDLNKLIEELEAEDDKSPEEDD